MSNDPDHSTTSLGTTDDAPLLAPHAVEKPQLAGRWFPIRKLNMSRFEKTAEDTRLPNVTLPKREPTPAASSDWKPSGMSQIRPRSMRDQLSAGPTLEAYFSIGDGKPQWHTVEAVRTKVGNQYMSMAMVGTPARRRDSMEVHIGKRDY